MKFTDQELEKILSFIEDIPVTQWRYVIDKDGLESTVFVYYADHKGIKIKIWHSISVGEGGCRRSYLEVNNEGPDFGNGNVRLLNLANRLQGVFNLTTYGERSEQEYADCRRDEDQRKREMLERI